MKFRAYIAALHAALFCLVLAVSPACSGSMMLLGVGTAGAAAAYVGQGDIVPGASGWWGLRAYNLAYATGSNSAAIVCDNATFLTCSTINILANGDFDTATASGSAACATACRVKSLTDQTGNGNTLTCASASVCPTLTFNCYGTKPCMTFAGGQTISSTNTMSLSSPYSYAIIAKRTGATGSINQVLGNSGNPIFGFQNVADTALWNPSGTVTLAALDNVAHSMQATNNSTGPLSVLYVDNTSASTATAGGSGTGIYYGSRNGGLTFTGNSVQGGVWAGTLFSAGNATALSAQDHAYWGF